MVRACKPATLVKRHPEIVQKMRKTYKDSQAPDSITFAKTGKDFARAVKNAQQGNGDIVVSGPDLSIRVNPKSTDRLNKALKRPDAA